MDGTPDPNPFRCVVDAIGDAIIVLDARGVVVHANPAAIHAHLIERVEDLRLLARPVAGCELAMIVVRAGTTERATSLVNKVRALRDLLRMLEATTVAGIPAPRPEMLAEAGRIAEECELGLERLLGIERDTAIEAHPPAAPRTARARGRVLVVDDESLLLKAYVRMLSPLCDVVTADSGQAALDRFEHDRSFDVILCDLLMPSVSGIDVFQAVERRWPDLCDRFVFATGGALTQSTERFLLEVTPHAWLKKPIDIERLIAIIQRRLSERDA